MDDFSDGRGRLTQFSILILHDKDQFLNFSNVPISILRGI